MAKPTGSGMDRIVALCKRRGFIFQSSEIYGGLNGFWDYGPLGTVGDHDPYQQRGRRGRIRREESIHA